MLLGTALILFPGCRDKIREKPQLCFNSAAFNATSAFAEIEALIEITPRHSGSPGAKKAAEHLLAGLRSAGVKADMDEFAEDTPAGRMVFRNVIGTISTPGDDDAAKEWIIIGAHYDAKSGIADNFQGANDSGSGAGVLLELARIVKDRQSARNKYGNFKKVGRGVSAEPSDLNFIFAFLDGEECRYRYAKNDGLHGSRRLAKQLIQDGRAVKTCAVIILDMVGDRELNITIPRNSDSKLISALFKAAEKEGTRGKFSLWPGEILDDHAPFLAAGMPAIDIIDYEYGSQPGRNDYWHTPEDTLDKLSPDSLEIVGRTVLRLLDDLM